MQALTPCCIQIAVKTSFFSMIFNLIMTKRMYDSYVCSVKNGRFSRFQSVSEFALIHRVSRSEHVMILGLGTGNSTGQSCHNM